MTPWRKFIASRPHIPYIAPISLWIIVFVIGPLLVIFYFSFLKTSATGQITDDLTLAHYLALLDPNYLTILFRTLAYALITNIACLLIGYPLAFWIVQYGGKWKNLFLMMVVLPSWTCYLIRIYALRTLIAHNGMINSILLNLKIISEPIDIMYTPLIVVIGLIFTWLPFMVLPIYASLEGLNQSLLEASLDLGASPLERFLTIILPLTKGGIFAGTILVFIP
jgi:spermidine/putrescine transport system permease protein